MPPKRKLNPWLKLALDLGPLVVFFAANSARGIYWGTGIFMVAILVSLAVSYAMTRHLAIMPVVSAIIVLVFGSLTIALHNDTFIKVKPTIIYALFGLTLLAGYVLNRPLLAIVFDSVFHLNQEGWRKLTLRWAAFFLVMAIVNEIVWRTQTTEFWISFKLFGFTPLTFLFGALQYPLLTKYAAGEPAADGAPADPQIEKRP